MERDEYIQELEEKNRAEKEGNDKLRSERVELNNKLSR